MTTTLENIHRDPFILDRAIAQQVPLEITADDGAVTATLLPVNGRKNPDFLTRAKKIWGENPPGKPLSEIVTESRGGHAPFNAVEHRAWLARTWGDRVFGDAEVAEMRDAEDGETER